jgi:hypothetical protein
MAADRRPAATARAGFTNLFGKIDDAPVNGLKLPLEVMEAAKAKAVEANLPFQEFLREVVTIGVMGREEVKRRFDARLDTIAGKVKEK